MVLNLCLNLPKWFEVSLRFSGFLLENILQAKIINKNKDFK